MKMEAKNLLIVGIAVLITIGISASSGYAEIEPDMVIGIWLFDSADDNIAIDSSGNGNDGEFKNGAALNEGVFGEALELNGAGAHVEYGVNDNLKPESLTLVAWFNTRKLNGYGHIFQSGKDWDDIAGVVFRVHQDGQFQAAVATGAGNVASWADSPALADDTWYHAAITFDDTSFILYMDGVEAARGGGGEASYDDRTVRTGVHPDDTGAAFDGFIDELALFNEALSPEDIVAIMNDGLEVAVNLAGSAVSSAGKLATTWGDIRARN